MPVENVLTGHALPAAEFSGTLAEAWDDLLWLPGVSRGPRSGGGQEHVSKLLERLEEQPVLESPEPVTVQGVFYPALLMTPGIWERSDSGEGAPPIEWRNPLQDWLFSGFEEWAPSWNLSVGTASDPDRPLFAQLGHEDEAFSLLLHVTGPGAAMEPQRLVPAGEMVCNVEVNGWLVHRGHLRESMPARMRKWGRKFDYALQVDLATEGHGIEPTDAAEPYSGYLWECVTPKEWLRGKGVPELVDSFFVWEHTDFASEAAREYGLAALAYKHEYIERHFGELQLIQKSAPIVPGEPLIATESFYSIIFGGSG